jgi:hypothetical protein
MMAVTEIIAFLVQRFPQAFFVSHADRRSFENWPI